MFDQTPHRPVVGALHRLFLVAAGVDQRGQLVEGEDDVRAELVLDPDRHLGGEAVGGAVEMRAERDAVVVDVGQPLLALGDDVVGLDPLGVHRQHLLEAGAQREHLEPAAVGEGRPRPVHERAEPACLLDDVGAGLQIQMVGVGQNRLRAKLFHGLRQHRLDGGLGADGDERRGVDVAVRSADDAGATEPSGQFGVNAEEGLASRRRFCTVKTRWAVAAAALLAVAGCSSGPPDYKPAPGTLVAGTAQVTVNGQNTGTTEAVQCTPAGSLTTITTGDQTSGRHGADLQQRRAHRRSRRHQQRRRLHRQLQRRARRHREGHDDRPDLRHHRNGRRLRHRQPQLPHLRHVRHQSVLLNGKRANRAVAKIEQWPRRVLRPHPPAGNAPRSR